MMVWAMASRAPHRKKLPHRSRVLDDVQFPNCQFVDLQFGEPCSSDRDTINRNAADGEGADCKGANRRGSDPWENDMLFVMSLNFTERGIREIKDDLKRAQAAQDLAKKCGCEIKQIFLTSGEYDVLQIIETANADNIAKYALANGSLGFVRSHTALAWPMEEATKIISELP
jgi:uncharacterized protein with GYD domain